MRTAILLSAMLAMFGIALAKEFPPDVEARHRAQVADEQKALEEAPSKPASEIMPKLVRSAALVGTYPDEVRLGFNRREVALAAIKKVPGYEQWFRDRLRTLFPPGAIERNTHYGGRLKMVAIPDEKRGETRHEQYALFMALERLATDEAIRILADYLWDDRFTYEPGDDYGSPSLAQDAVGALSSIRRARKLTGTPTGNEPVRWQEWWTANKGNFLPQPK